MQRILILFLALLAACNSTPEQRPVPPAPGSAYPAYYAYYLNTLDTSTAASMQKALRVFGFYFKNLDTSVADSGFVKLDAFYSRLLLSLNQQHEAKQNDYDSLVMDYRKYPEELPVSKSLRDYDSTLRANGFCIDMQEGISYVKEDRSIFKKYCYSYLSKTAKTFLEQEALEIRQGLSDDAALTISPGKLADRALWWEHFSQKHPKHLFHKNAQDYHRYYLSLLLQGMNNTYVLEEDSTISSYFKEAYKQLSYAFPGSETNKQVQAYVQLVKKKNMRGADSLLDLYRKKGIILVFEE